MKVLVSLNFPPLGIEMLKQEGLDVTVWKNDIPMTREELIQATKEHDILLSSSIYTLDADFLEKNKHLKLISQFAVGYNNIDIEKATELGIPVTNTPNAMTDATADIAFALMLAVSRKMFHMHKTIISGDWGHFRPQANLGMELKGKTVGIFGMGRIGSEFARRCLGAYNMKVIYHNRRPNTEMEKELNASYVSFEELLKESDVLSVHAGLSNETKGLFNADVFSKMKSSAIFINTARGGLHHEKSLIEALQNKVIWGAGLDVTNPEPMNKDNPLLNMENVAITPHIGSATVESRNEMSRLVALNIIQFSRGEPLTNLVSPGV
ncbi:2-hydroxyacid dehydrogenase [Maribacter aurantiacus]|uniref:Glyoxylate/hydroxypyruvate reductase B n=1 Tax=Maribacter aurantiacus TaxID=1882343 RepID=A0A5R8M6Q9_9FLAO|nr:D-glycerate dehydrogenase [Maribacter aurantiacus]TLF45237.1 D-glycerate dehydrogenase [Maribacter aurantiacus]